MPPFNHKRIVVEDNNAHDDLGHNDANTGADGDPSEHVDGTNGVALFPVNFGPAIQASNTYHSPGILFWRQQCSPMVLSSSGWIPCTQLRQTQRSGAHQK